MQQLPTSLEHEPLVDAVFEVRLISAQSLADILTGFLFHALQPSPTITRLPTADIPQPMRADDPNLRFAPVMQLQWGNYFISLGDRNIVISCKLPYPKWSNFKSFILETIRRIATVGIVGQVERYSIKYVNLIKANTLAAQSEKIRMGISLGSRDIKSDPVNLQVSNIEHGITHILSVIIGVEGKMADGEQVSGALVSIDSIILPVLIEFNEFTLSMEPELERLKQANKAKFFDCLTPEAINQMGPIYA
jgi:uncharacterized protein (TIGR04255 family)